MEDPNYLLELNWDWTDFLSEEESIVFNSIPRGSFNPIIGYKRTLPPAHFTDKEGFCHCRPEDTWIMQEWDLREWDAFIRPTERPYPWL